MDKLLELVIMYVWYFIMGLIGVCLGSLIMGVGINPFTSWIPYTLAIVLTLLDFVLNKEEY